MSAKRVLRMTYHAKNSCSVVVLEKRVIGDEHWNRPQTAKCMCMVKRVDETDSGPVDTRIMHSHVSVGRLMKTFRKKRNKCQRNNVATWMCLCMFSLVEFKSELKSTRPCMALWLCDTVVSYCVVASSLLNRSTKKCICTLLLSILYAYLYFLLLFLFQSPHNTQQQALKGAT